MALRIKLPTLTPRHVFIALIAFWAMWIYKAVLDYQATASHQSKVDEFMNRGNRFTSDDGEELRALIQSHVTENHDQIGGIYDKLKELEPSK